MVISPSASLVPQLRFCFAHPAWFKIIGKKETESRHKINLYETHTAGFAYLVHVRDFQGICTTALKRACRKVGIPKWPFRNERKSDKKPATSNSSGSESELSEQCTEPGDRHGNMQDFSSSDDSGHSDRCNAYSETKPRVSHPHKTRSRFAQEEQQQVKREYEVPQGDAAEECQEEARDQVDVEDSQEEDPEAEEEEYVPPPSSSQFAPQPAGLPRHHKSAVIQLSDVCDAVEACVMLEDGADASDECNDTLDGGGQETENVDWFSDTSLSLSMPTREYPDAEEWKWCLKSMAVRILSCLEFFFLILDQSFCACGNAAVGKT
jgi:hypothetical protein